LFIFVAVFVTFVIVAYVASYIFLLLVWHGANRVRRLVQGGIVFPALVRLNFVGWINSSGSLVGKRRMRQSLARPTLSFDESGMSVWFDHRHPVPGAFVSSSQIESIELILDRSTNRLAPGMRISVRQDGVDGKLDFRVTRMTLFGLVSVRNRINLDQLMSEIQHLLKPDLESSV
jgi:hypothetical protein